VAPDIFDILDVSLREDTYSRLIVEILKQSPGIKAAVFEELTGHVPTGDAHPTFRRGIGEKGGKHHPDIVVKCPTAEGIWWLVIEAKVQSGEGWGQTSRYWQAVQQYRENDDICGYTLIFLTLTGEPPTDEHWQPMTHYRLAQLIAQHDGAGLLGTHPVISAPWRAYTARLEHYEAFGPPGEGEPILGWLCRPDEYFVTKSERARVLDSLLVPQGYEGLSGMNVARGREQFLTLAWLPYWVTGEWREGGDVRLEDCIQVHFEIDVPIPFSGSFGTCHIHCEAHPYMRKREVERLGDEAEGFLRLMECLREEIHLRLPGTSWRPSRYWLQKARFRFPMSHATTIGQLRDLLLPEFDAVHGRITEALVAAGRRCGLGWWQRVEAESAVG